jgi:hypothetical protein
MMKELEDYNWFPASLRRFQTDFIGSMVQWTHLYRPLVPSLQELAQQPPINRIQDLCSGSGLPALYLHRRLQNPPPLVLSDKFPSSVKGMKNVVYLQTPLDVLDFKPEPGVCYTMFNSFHHFNKEEQQAIVQNMKDAGAAFIFAEILEPGPLTFIKIFITGTLAQALVAPFIKPFLWKRLLFTWILPVNLVTVTIDGLISVIKSRTATQYRRLLGAMATPKYNITIQRKWGWQSALIFIQGKPL